MFAQSVSTSVDWKMGLGLDPVGGDNVKGRVWTWDTGIVHDCGVENGFGVWSCWGDDARLDGEG